MPTRRPPAPALLFEATQRHQAALRQNLHDSLVQTLGGATLMVRVLARRSGVSGATAAALAEVEGALERAARETRLLTESLEPITREPGRLTAALRRLADQAARTVPVEFLASDDLTPPSDHAAAALFLLAHEAVQNVLQHAGARRLRLELQQRATGLELRIEDDGCGLARPSQHPGRGLAILRACAQAAGGRLRLRSRPGQGMLVTCLAPA